MKATIDMEPRAKAFATAAHAAVKQRRKYTGAPYIVHPAAVVEIVRSVPHTVGGHGKRGRGVVSAGMGAVVGAAVS